MILSARGLWDLRRSRPQLVQGTDGGDARPLGVVKVTINGAAFHGLREVLGADRQTLGETPESAFQDHSFELGVNSTNVALVGARLRGRP